MPHPCTETRVVVQLTPPAYEMQAAALQQLASLVPCTATSRRFTSPVQSRSHPSGRSDAKDAMMQGTRTLHATNGALPDLSSAEEVTAVLLDIGVEDADDDSNDDLLGEDLV